MKKVFLFISLLFFVCSIHAQDIFKKHGFKRETLTLSKGRYEEVFTNNEIVQIGTILLNTKTNKVVKFLEADTTKFGYKAETSSRFLQIDPLAEKFPWLSPYVYCANNPLKYVDPDGRDIIISGALASDAFKQLQSAVSGVMTLSMDDAGKVGYTLNSDAKLNGNAKALAGVINDNSVTVNLKTTDQNTTSTGNLMIGGAFMGNTVTTDAQGNSIVSANQEVNPNVLGSADAHTKTPGKMMMHETTEAYQGAKISQKEGVVGTGHATQADIANPQSVYMKAHNSATPQSTVNRTMYDKNGRVTNEMQQAVRVEWSVSKFGNSKVIQTLP